MTLTLIPKGSPKLYLESLPLLEGEYCSLRDITWDKGIATVSASLWTRSPWRGGPMTDGQARHRIRMPLSLARPPGVTGPVTVRLIWQRYVATADGWYTLQPADAAPPVELRDVPLP